MNKLAPLDWLQFKRKAVFPLLKIITQKKYSLSWLKSAERF